LGDAAGVYGGGGSDRDGLLLSLRKFMFIFMFTFTRVMTEIRVFDSVEQASCTTRAVYIAVTKRLDG
jgi:hypothetical protein